MSHRYNSIISDQIEKRKVVWGRNVDYPILFSEYLSTIISRLVCRFDIFCCCHGHTLLSTHSDKTSSESKCERSKTEGWSDFMLSNFTVEKTLVGTTSASGGGIEMAFEVESP